MAITVQITGGRKVENGHEIAYSVNGRGGQGIVFSSRADLAQWVDDNSLTAEDLLALLFRIWKAKDPTMTLANVTGRSITFDPTAPVASVLKVS